MQILREIIEGAISSDTPISGLLRKCLVMAYQLNNVRLKAWVDTELDGYTNGEPIPEYRQVNAGAKGYFIGPYGAEIRNQPLPPAVLEPEHQHWASTLDLVQPIAAYELLVDRSKSSDVGGEAVIEWPANLTARYQTKFIRGYTLNRAWQEIPHSSIVSLVDTVRNRVLRFALELRQELGDVSDDPTTLPAEKVDQYVTNYIFGGNNVFSGTTQGVTQIGNIVVAKGDLTGLKASLEHIGVSEDDFADLTAALVQDAPETTAPKSLGQRTTDWLKKVSLKLGREGLQTGGEIAKEAIKGWILQYLGAA